MFTARSAAQRRGLAERLDDSEHAVAGGRSRGQQRGCDVTVVRDVRGERVAVGRPHHRARPAASGAGVEGAVARQPQRQQGEEG